MIDHDTMHRWLKKQERKTKAKNLPIITALGRLVDADLLWQPKPPAPSATAVSEPPYSPGYLPEALPPAAAPPRLAVPDDPTKRRTRDLIHVQGLLEDIERRARLMFEREYPDRSVEWDQLNSHTKRPYMEQARDEKVSPITEDIEFAQAEIEERAKALFVLDNLTNGAHHTPWVESSFKDQYRERAIEELRVEHRARDRYEDQQGIGSSRWDDLPEKVREGWVVNERNAMR